MRKQADFTGAPDLPEGPHLIYADVWERTVFAGQNAALTDPGLHGTETSYRTKTMVQLKTLPLGEGGFTDAQSIMEGDPQFARAGTATLEMTTQSCRSWGALRAALEARKSPAARTQTAASIHSVRAANAVKTPVLPRVRSQKKISSFAMTGSGQTRG